MSERTGWLLDLYEDRQEGGVVLWLLEQGGSRTRLCMSFPLTMYAAGPVSGLRAAWNYLSRQPLEVSLARAQRRDLFAPDPLTVLQIQVARAAGQPRLFEALQQRFPDLDYYDADIPLLPRFAARYDVFPLTRCRVTLGAGQTVENIISLESRWNLDPSVVPLRVLSLEPDTDPFHAPPAHLLLRCGRYSYRLSLAYERPLLVNLAAILTRHDPDLIETSWGDTWLLPHLLELSDQWGIPLPLNRDPERQATHKAERTYFTYGTVMHRGRQIFLHGRWHIDRLNAMMFADYGVDGALELARVSGLPVQTAARNSPGAGITAMQMITALRQGVLVPYHKQQTEDEKSAHDLIKIDRGGLVYQPLVGLHRDVAEIDFVSMYPSIMRRFNISPETVGRKHLDPTHIQGLETFASLDRPGLVPETLAPLLDKRIGLKSRLAQLSPRDCWYRSYKARSSALKWLLVVCFGYTGYKHAKFGRIEAHEAITAYSREALLRAKEAAEDAGFTVLHMYVDGLWIHKPGAGTVADIQPVLDEIAGRAGLPIALDGIYKWVVFLPSRLNSAVPVANRYFGVFQSGEIKVRGIETRRSDTPRFIAQAQMEVLKRLAGATTASALAALAPDMVALLRKRLNDLRRGRVPLEHLVVRQKLSRALEVYRVPSPAALAARQLEATGKEVCVGQSVRFLYVRDPQKVLAWDLPDPPDPAAIDVARYTQLLVRAASTVLQPLGIAERTLQVWLSNPSGYGTAMPIQLGLPGRGGRE